MGVEVLTWQWNYYMRMGGLYGSGSSNVRVECIT